VVGNGCEYGGRCPQQWSERPVPSHQTQAGSKGVAVEYMVKLANAVNASVWFTSPDTAGAVDGYIRSFASEVAATLHADAKVYVEWRHAAGGAADNAIESLTVRCSQLQVANLRARQRSPSTLQRPNGPARVLCVCCIWSEIIYVVGLPKLFRFGTTGRQCMSPSRWLLRWCVTICRRITPKESKPCV
jgi:hypothetical protein